MGDVIYLFKGGSIMKREISIHDVANTLLTFEEMTNKKLQKLCYYAQAWYLALYKKELFENEFQAWVHGPVCKELYDVYKINGWNDITEPMSGRVITEDDIAAFLGIVYNTYGEFDGDELEILTHSEEPWRQAREGLEEWEPSNNIISKDLMQSYYWDVYEQAQND